MFLHLCYTVKVTEQTRCTPYGYHRKGREKDHGYTTISVNKKQEGFNEQKHCKHKFLVSTALIAAISSCCDDIGDCTTLASEPSEIRISEVLMLMAFIDKKYAPVWCLAVSSRTASAFGMMDVVFGTACTAACQTKCSKTLFGASLWRSSDTISSALSCICSAVRFS